MNIVAVLAGGMGNRMGAMVPKQFISIAGKMLIEHSLDVFERHSAIDEIVVVVHRDYEATMRTLQAKGLYRKWKKIVVGGEERFFSSWAALQACDSYSEGNILIHDAARPFVSAALIDRLLSKLRVGSAVIPVLPVTDTLVEVCGDAVVCAPNRNKFRKVQTPQAFRLPIIKKAYKMAIKDANSSFTDDCSVILHYLPHEPILFTEGERNNQKLTYSTDIELFEKIFLEKR